MRSLLMRCRASYFNLRLKSLEKPIKGHLACLWAWPGACCSRAFQDQGTAPSSTCLVSGQDSGTLRLEEGEWMACPTEFTCLGSGSHSGGPFPLQAPWLTLLSSSVSMSPTPASPHQASRKVWTGAECL